MFAAISRMPMFQIKVNSQKWITGKVPGGRTQTKTSLTYWKVSASHTFTTQYRGFDQLRARQSQGPTDLWTSPLFPNSGSHSATSRARRTGREEEESRLRALPRPKSAKTELGCTDQSKEGPSEPRITCHDSGPGTPTADDT